MSDGESDLHGRDGVSRIAAGFRTRAVSASNTRCMTPRLSQVGAFLCVPAILCSSAQKSRPTGLSLPPVDMTVVFWYCVISMKNTSVNIKDDQTWRRFKGACVAEGLSISTVIEMLITQWLKKPTRKPHRATR